MRVCDGKKEYKKRGGEGERKGERGREREM